MSVIYGLCMQDGWTSLMVAARSQNPEVLQLLLDNDAKVNAENKVKGGRGVGRCSGLWCESRVTLVHCHARGTSFDSMPIHSHVPHTNLFLLSVTAY